MLHATLMLFFLDAIAPTPVSQWVSGSVIDSFRFGDSYRISELCVLVFWEMRVYLKINLSRNTDFRSQVTLGRISSCTCVDYWPWWPGRLGWTRIWRPKNCSLTHWATPTGKHYLQDRETNYCQKDNRIQNLCVCGAKMWCMVPLRTSSGAS